jgi:hypothetical protein
MRGTPKSDDVKGDYLIELARQWCRGDTIGMRFERSIAPGGR